MITITSKQSQASSYIYMLIETDITVDLMLVYRPKSLLSLDTNVRVVQV